MLTEHWPVAVGDIRIEWRVEDRRVTAVSAIVPVTDTDELPTVRPSDTPGVKLEINVGRNTRQDEIEGVLRTIRNLLSLFASADIDFDHVDVAWEPENDEDRQRLELISIGVRAEKADINQPHCLGFDLVARAMVSAKSAAHYEIPLGFLRRGSRDIHAGRYIEAYYNLFFFLETLFAPGYSDPKKVKQELLAAAPVRNAVAYARAQMSKDARGKTPKGALLVAMPDAQLIGHLVKLRGGLHHHALRRPGVWHPDKPKEFRDEAILLQEIVHKIAMDEAMGLLFRPERDADLMGSAEKAGATAILRIEAVGIVEGVRTDLRPVTFRIAGSRIDRAMVNHAHRTFRRQFPGGPRNVVLLEYRIMSENRSQVYAVWRRTSQTVPTHSGSID